MNAEGTKTLVSQSYNENPGRYSFLVATGTPSGKYMVRVRTNNYSASNYFYVGTSIPIFTIISKSITTQGSPQTNGANNFSTSSLMAKFVARVDAVGGDVLITRNSSVYDIIPNFVVYYNGKPTSISSFSNVSISADKQIIKEGSSGIINIDFMMKGRSTNGVALSEGVCSVGLSGIKWKYNSNNNATNDEKLEWRTTDVLFECGSNPKTVLSPIIQSINYQSGGPGMTILVNGLNFSTITQNSITFLNSTTDAAVAATTHPFGGQIMFKVPPPSEVRPGVYNILVENSLGQRSNAVPFTILAATSTNSGSNSTTTTSNISKAQISGSCVMSAPSGYVIASGKLRFNNKEYSFDGSRYSEWLPSNRIMPVYLYSPREGSIASYVYTNPPVNVGVGTTTALKIATIVTGDNGIIRNIYNLNPQCDNYTNITAEATPSATVKPSITVISPNGGEVYKVGDRINIKWNLKGGRDSDTYTISLRDPNAKAGTAAMITVDTIVRTSGIDGSSTYVWTIPSTIKTGNYKIEIFSKNAGYDISNNYFSIVNLASVTYTPTPTYSPTQTYNSYPTATYTSSPTYSPTPTYTSSPTYSSTPTYTYTPSPTYSSSPSYSSSPIYSSSPTYTSSPSYYSSPTSSPSPSSSPTSFYDVDKMSLGAAIFSAFKGMLGL
jgi:hypothetical protein